MLSLFAEESSFPRKRFHPSKGYQYELEGGKYAGDGWPSC